MRTLCAAQPLLFCAPVNKSYRQKLHCNALPVFVPGMFYISDAASLNPFIRREIILWREMVGLQETKQMLAAASKRRGASLLPGGSTGTSNKLHELRQILSAAS